MNEDVHLRTTIATVAHPKRGEGIPQAFIFWLCIAIVVTTVYLAIKNQLSGAEQILSPAFTLLFGYWLSEQKQKIKKK